MIFSARVVYQQREESGKANTQKTWKTRENDRNTLNSRKTQYYICKGSGKASFSSFRASIRRLGKRAKAVDELRETIRKLYVEKTRTSGIKDVFSSQEKMLDFTIHTHRRGSRMLNDVDILDSFNRHCIENNLAVAKTLYETVGPLEDYEATIEEGKADGLVDYIQERLVDLLLDGEKEETRRVMQRKFEKVLKNFRCSDCGRDATKASLQESKLCCPCGSSWTLFCVNCGAPTAV